MPVSAEVGLSISRAVGTGTLCRGTKVIGPPMVPRGRVGHRAAMRRAARMVLCDLMTVWRARCPGRSDLPA